LEKLDSLKKAQDLQLSKEQIAFKYLYAISVITSTRHSEVAIETLTATG